MYLLYTTSFVKYKSLHSDKYFTAGWVVQQLKDCCLVIGKVNHSNAVSSAR